MSLISRIFSHKIEGSSKKKITQSSPVSTPIATKNIDTLPAGNAALALKPIEPSDFFNEKDLARYKIIQRQFAQDMTNTANIPIENVLARIPNVGLGDAKEMTNKSQLGVFTSSTNVISLNPIKELFYTENFFADEATVVHETTHAYLHNLRRAYANTKPRKELWDSVMHIIMQKALLGERNIIMKGNKVEEINGQQVKTTSQMRPPVLSAKERLAFVKVFGSINDNHLDKKEFKLNEEGTLLIKEKFLPELDEYYKGLGSSSKKTQSAVLTGMTDYANALLYRGLVLFEDMTSQNRIDLPDNIKTPLTKEEIAMAEESIEGLIYTKEGNYARETDKYGLIQQSRKDYFTSYEEQLARKNENKYRKMRLNDKIEKINSMGLKPTEKHVKEMQTVENNLRLIDLISDYKDIEQKIISAQHDPKKLHKYYEFASILKREFKSSGYKKFTEKMKNISLELNQDPSYINKTKEEKQLIIKKLLTRRENKYFEMISGPNNVFTKINQVDIPEKFLADTDENTALKTEFQTILSEIKNLVKSCDLTGIPMSFYESDAVYENLHKSASESMIKWAKRLAVVK